MCVIGLFSAVARGSHQPCFWGTWKVLCFCVIVLKKVIRPESLDLYLMTIRIKETFFCNCFQEFGTGKNHEENFFSCPVDFLKTYFKLS